MAIALASIRDLLLPGLYKVSGEYEKIPQRWSQIFPTRKSDMALERAVQMRYLGLAQLKNEGGPTAFDNNAGERYTYNQEHMEVGLGYAITRKAIDDNLYKAQFNPTNLGLQNSFVQFKEIVCADIFNSGTTYNPTIGGDGVALFSTAHPIDGATVANRPSVDVDLNESSLLNAMISIRQTFLDQAGLKIQARARKLLIPSQLEPVAIRLLRTELRPGTANNDVNAILSTTGGLQDGYMVNEFFTSSSYWFLQTATPGLSYMQRIAFEMDMQVDFTTDSLLVKAYERFSASYWDWRAVWGSFPSS